MCIAAKTNVSTEFHFSYLENTGLYCTVFWNFITWGMKHLRCISAWTALRRIIPSYYYLIIASIKNTYLEAQNVSGRLPDREIDSELCCAEMHKYVIFV